MTNRKIKHAQLNMRMNQVFDANAWIILGTLVCLHRMGESKRRIADVLEEFRTETVPFWAQYAAADIQAPKLTEQLRLLKIDFAEVVAVANYISPIYNSGVIVALAENLGVLLLQINHSFGYGRKRLMCLLDDLIAYKAAGGDARADAKRLFGAEVYSDELPDIDALRSRKPTISPEEVERYRREMDAVKALHEHFKLVIKEPKT